MNAAARAICVMPRMAMSDVRPAHPHQVRSSSMITTM